MDEPEVESLGPSLPPDSTDQLYFDVHNDGSAHCSLSNQLSFDSAISHVNIYDNLEHNFVYYSDDVAVTLNYFIPPGTLNPARSYYCLSMPGQVAGNLDCSGLSYDVCYLDYQSAYGNPYIGRYSGFGVTRDSGDMLMLGSFILFVQLLLLIGFFWNSMIKRY